MSTTNNNASRNQVPEEVKAQYTAVIEELKRYTDLETIVSIFEEKGAGIDESVKLYIEEVLKVPHMTEEREAEIIRTVAAAPDHVDGSKIYDDDPRLPLIEGYLMFALCIASNYMGKGLFLLDLVSAGCQGLANATVKFNYADPKYKFAEYAMWHIRHEIITNLEESWRCFENVFWLAEYRKITEFTKQFRFEFGRDPNVKEINEHTHLRVEIIPEIINYGKRSEEYHRLIEQRRDSFMTDYLPDEA